MTGKFIYTKDEKTKDKLVSAGYILIQKTQTGVWVFINKNQLVFDKLDKVFTSDTLIF